MVDNKTKTSLIRHKQKNNISLMKINYIILVLHTHIILLSSFMIYFFCICHSGSFPIVLIEKDLGYLHYKMNVIACVPHFDNHFLNS